MHYLTNTPLLPVVPLTADCPTRKKCSYGSRALESCWSSLPFNLHIRSITTPSRAYFLNGFEPCLFLSVLSPTTSVLASLSFILTMTLPLSLPHHSLPSPPQASHSAIKEVTECRGEESGLENQKSSSCSSCWSDLGQVCTSLWN